MDGMYASFAGAKACREKSKFIEALFIINQLKKPDNNIRVKKKPRGSEASGGTCRLHSGANNTDKSAVMTTPDPKFYLAFCLRI